MKKIIIAVFLLFSLQSCKEKSNEITSEIPRNKEISNLSLYNLPSQWTTQDGKNIELKSLNGNILVMVMIYTSCKAACPRLVADMKILKQS